ncbi:beta strand repeat-containing protein [Phycisphaera mikurensis]|uniref:PEP-CTERM protein-sorting domain-containing protein n=1 Tax=Phycisphaera mikurensis (strain NBRC 102666 / KCTC 22515 / FYK2301M01) TaxID=1142394 RepID=I0IJ44_PHYMF|nr:PEP-CTERM sorting domain-containing protein [Phycisphaera mikurensis]MBB6443129.1 hypothetical protein [Phycisphaera mikurensis]BAM05282.1 hypothetical protein PSMK_31230 [Phycisphaera mikurensis NBRC 102666]
MPVTPSSPRSAPSAARRTAVLLAASCASFGGAGSAFADEVTVTGATLFEEFFKVAANASDFIDADNDGVITDFTANGGVGTVDILYGGANPFFAQQYRAIGSGNGFQELINYGSVNGPGSSFAAINALNGGAPNVRNTGEVPIGNFTGPATADIATLDVPASWFVTDTSAQGRWDLAPRTGSGATPGYGNGQAVSNPVYGTTADPLQAGGQGNTLKSLTPSSNSAAPGTQTLNTNTGSPDANTLFETQLALSPIAFVANAGAAVDSTTSTGAADGNIKKSELQHLFVTGRTVSGENLVAITRDSGSGTRNGAMNSIGVDPSWGTGDNVGRKNKGSGDDLDTPGPDYIPTNKNSSSRLENTVQNTRLGVSYNGIVGNAGPDSVGNRYEILNVANDLDATWDGTSYVRPQMTDDAGNNVVFNDDANTGHQIGATQTFVTIGDPFAGDIHVDGSGNIVAGPGTGIKTFAGNGSGNPEMADKKAALYIRNIQESIDAFVAAPTNPATEGTPGEYLASNFALVNAASALADPTAPGTFITNVNTNPDLQQVGVLPTEAIEASYGGDHGTVPNRDSGTIYTDGQSANYLTNGGTAVNYASTLAAGTAIGEANAIAGDFDGDQVRDTDDIDDMVAAAEAAASGFAARAALGQDDQVLEIIGDFNADGNFDAEDVRYGADGLFTRGRSSGTLDRAANFAEVDAASTSGNFFGTTLATGKAYAAGDARGDIAGSGDIAAGANPLGADGTVAAEDIDAVYENFVGLNLDATAGVQWSNIEEIANAVNAKGSRVDLSADMNGDLTIDQTDVDAVVRGILGTEYGDANLDRTVGAADVSVLSGNFGQAAGWAGGSFDGDGQVGAADVSVLSGNFGFEGSGSNALAFASAVAPAVGSAVSAPAAVDAREVAAPSGDAVAFELQVGALADGFDTIETIIELTAGTIVADADATASLLAEGDDESGFSAFLTAPAAFGGKGLSEFGYTEQPTLLSATYASLGNNSAASSDVLLAQILLGQSLSETAGTYTVNLFDNGILQDTLTASFGGFVIPEPATAAVLGLGGLTLLRRRRNA